MARSCSIILDNSKVRFLEQIKHSKKENTYVTYSRILTGLQRYEDEEHKEFEAFTLDEYRYFLISAYTQPSTIRVALSVLSLYYSFLQKEGIANIGINPIENLKFDEEIKDLFDNKFIYKYLTEKELKIIIGMLYNARDKVLLLLAWLGLTNDEILSLERKNIKIDQNYLMVEGKIFKLDDYTKDMISFAMLEDTYYTKNGKYDKHFVVSTQTRYDSKKFGNTPYLIRGFLNKKCTSNIFQKSFQILRELDPRDFNRVDDIGLSLFLKCKYITMNTIYKSRIFHDLYEIEKKYRKDNKEEFKMRPMYYEKKLQKYLKDEISKKFKNSFCIFRDYELFRDKSLIE